MAASECARPRAQQYSSAGWWENSPRLGKCHVAAPGTGALRRSGNSTSAFGLKAGEDGLGLLLVLVVVLVLESNGNSRTRTRNDDEDDPGSVNPSPLPGLGWERESILPVSFATVCVHAWVRTFQRSWITWIFFKSLTPSSSSAALSYKSRFVLTSGALAASR